MKLQRKGSLFVMMIVALSLCMCGKDQNEKGEIVEKEAQKKIQVEKPIASLGERTVGLHSGKPESEQEEGKVGEDDARIIALIGKKAWAEVSAIPNLDEAIVKMNASNAMLEEAEELMKKGKEKEADKILRQNAIFMGQGRTIDPYKKAQVLEAIMKVVKRSETLDKRRNSLTCGAEKELLEQSIRRALVYGKSAMNALISKRPERALDDVKQANRILNWAENRG